ncbi:phospholipase D/nuclease [Xylona heveae TC161]|uniref:Phospholipase n=1 Tax=Xylona heveae (strain CBS 132557 / TC161) TaxID=1328760 RepID=A0A165JQA4_XYLHT|nr:phospholipase D/nuclease [Xylona heveae TC161]KZF26507.1 phospholipase D/nuclease [Xylona heveae TC161]
MAGQGHDDPLAYGEFHDGNFHANQEGGERGLLGDAYRFFQSRQHHSGSSQAPPGQSSSVTQQYQPHLFNQPQASSFEKPSSTSAEQRSSFNMSSILDTISNAVHGIGHEIVEQFSGEGDIHSHTHTSGQCSDGAHDPSQHRFGSFAPQRDGNDVKWFVDGCGYFWAVSRALENASQSIWILDWWLSPELYLRRPPAKNEQYRLDRMLQAAAQRGVKINVIVYKEVTQALTRKYLSPTLPDYIHSLLPSSTDPITSILSRLGLAATFASLEEVEAQNPLITPPVTVSSSHTKHALEELHPNISVFRHPDHLPDAQTFQSSLTSSLQKMTLDPATASKLPEDALKALYGMNEDVILYWAHHEKLLLVDGEIAFMGGLDLCFGRWDLNQHPVADAHPEDLSQIVFPGQDFNNARIMDFQDVSNWQNNKLDRKTNSRMGWSDLSISLRGPVVEDLKVHFVDRWNFIFNEKYNVREDSRYSRLSVAETQSGIVGQPPSQADVNQASSGFAHYGHELKYRLHEGVQHVRNVEPDSSQNIAFSGGVPCQIVRSCSKWSGGVPTEHSVANAYIEVIKNSQHFIYIENQFFITATSDAQRPVKNKIGAAIVERILRAARAGQTYKVIVLMPAIPAFAGDLRNDDSLSTRAIMEFQYNSINRGGHSIMELIAKEGFDPTKYIRFYNLRNYDRINSSAFMRDVQNASGVDYEDARKQFDDYYSQEGPAKEKIYGQNQQYQRYQEAAQQMDGQRKANTGRWDTVSECYMLGGQDIRSVPWDDGELSEIDAFVSEELYIHTKLLIADDRIVICGSANLNDRSQLGDHDSEIAIVIEDPTPLDSYLNEQPWKASKFAATLRRQLFRKHLGLLPPQDMERPDQNFEPIGVPNAYDYGSAEDHDVVDPLSDRFLNLWNSTAKQNTDAFARVFHPVPYDGVRTWKDYDAYYERFFKDAEKEKDLKPSQYKWGHVVAEDFPPGDVGVQEVKKVLSTIRGTLVEMPLMFLIKEDIAKEGISLNAFTEAVYT